MDDLISRQAAIALAKDICVPTGDGGVYRTRSIDPQEVRELPAVQPEIIRCKDCKYRYLDGMIWNCPFGLSGGEDFFCAYGAIGGGSGT